MIVLEIIFLFLAGLSAFGSFATNQNSASIRYLLLTIVFLVLGMVVHYVR